MIYFSGLSCFCDNLYFSSAFHSIVLILSILLSAPSHFNTNLDLHGNMFSLSITSLAQGAVTLLLSSNITKEISLDPDASAL